ncbi:MAG: hypothetical protein KAG97_10850 [Victivallales bacterium]|nr:hypothetical protein [Victivallales bacterium]
MRATTQWFARKSVKKRSAGWLQSNGLRTTICLVRLLRLGETPRPTTHCDSSYVGAEVAAVAAPDRTHPTLNPDLKR